MGDRKLITRLFISLFGVVHFCNFYSLNVQLERLFLSDGLIPVKAYIDKLLLNDSVSSFDKLLSCTSIFVLFNSDFFITCCAMLGLLLSLMVIAGFHSRWCFLLIFPLYMSFANAGQELYSFQWDSLILESTFLAILLPCSGYFYRRFERGPDLLVNGLFLWLLFRLYIESGVAKLFWGPNSWSTLDAMSHYYETAPIPTAIGYWFHFLPEWWHELETSATLIIEILIAGLIFAGKWPRRTAFVLLTGFQILIILTANYGIFNYTTLCLHLFLLKDRDLHSLTRYIPKLKAWVGEKADLTPQKPKLWLYPIAVIIVSFSIIEFMMFAGGRGVHSTKLAKVQKYTSATRIASRYHLFGPIDPIRYEMVYECRYGDSSWVVMNLPYKIDELTDRAPFVAPHHPRVDFRMWFERYPASWGKEATMPYKDLKVSPSVLSGYLERLSRQLLDSPILAYRHFLPHKYTDSIPVEVRISYYHYNMLKDDSLTDQFWTRKPVGVVYIDPALDSTENRFQLKNPPPPLPPEEIALNNAIAAVQKNPTAGNYLNLGVAFYNVRKYNECIQASIEVLRIDPNNHVAYNNICTAYNQLGDFQKAYQACQACLQLKPDYGRAKNNLNYAIRMLKSRK
jgi:hypothetical protein